MQRVNVLMEGESYGVKKESPALAAQLLGVALVATVVTLTFYGIQRSGVVSFLQFFLPVPMVFLSLRYSSLWSGFAAASLSTVAIALWLGSRPGLLFLFGTGVVALIMSTCFLRKYTATNSISCLTVYYVALGMFVVYIQEGLTFTAHTQRLMELFMQHQQEFISLYGKQGLPLHQLESLFESLARMMSVTFPFISAFVFALMTYFVIRMLLKLQRVTLPPLRHFQDWGISDNMVWIFILGGVLYHLEATRIAGVNILLGLVFLYYLQGCAVITFILRYKETAKVLQFIAYLLLFIQIPYSLTGLGLVLTGSAVRELLFLLPAVILVAGIGLANVWIDFRKRLKQANL